MQIYGKTINIRALFFCIVSFFLGFLASPSPVYQEKHQKKYLSEKNDLNKATTTSKVVIDKTTTDLEKKIIVREKKTYHNIVSNESKTKQTQKNQETNEKTIDRRLGAAFLYDPENFKHSEIVFTYRLPFLHQMGLVFSSDMEFKKYKAGLIFYF